MQSVSDGVDFLGYIVRSDYLLVRRRVVNHLKEKLQVFEQDLVKRDDDGVCYYSFDEESLNLLHAVLSSYLGHFKKANTFRLWDSIWTRGFLQQYFVFDESRRKLIRQYLVPKQLSNVRQQYSFFRWRFPDDVLFFQVGRFFEFYGHLSQRVVKL